MIVYRCDLCKSKETINQSLGMHTLRVGHGNETALWDVCTDCLPKLTETLGEGRKINYTPKSTNK